MHHKTYIPVPVWNGQTRSWEPWNYATWTQMDWPEGFDPATLPQPPVALGQVVYFYWPLLNGRMIMRGDVQKISLRGGTVKWYVWNDTPKEILYQKAVDEAIKERYCLEQLYLDVYANGHVRWVTLSMLVPHDVHGGQVA